MLEGRLPYLWLVLLTLGVWAQVLTFDFVHFDDTKLVLNNFNFIKNPAHLGVAFRHDVFYPDGRSAYYRPMQTVSLMLGALVSGVKPWGYFLIYLSFHAVAVVLVFRFFTSMQSDRAQAFFFSLIFAIHPMLTQAIAWIPGGNDILFTIFTLASFLYFVRFIKVKKTRDSILHILFFTFAIFTKESGVMLVPLSILYFFTWREKKTPIRTIIPVLGAWIIISTAWYVLRASAIGGGIIFTEVLKNVLANSPALFLYIGKTVVPIALFALPTLGGAALWYGIAAAILIAAALIFSSQKRLGTIMFGFMWYLLFLLPSFYSDDPSKVALFYEHRVYLPVLGVFLIIMEIDVFKKLNTQKNKIAVGTYIAVIILFAGRSIVHARNFQDRLHFWQHTVATTPHLPRSHSGLGSTYFDRKEYDRAEKAYRTGLALEPDEPVLHGNLGLLLLATGRFEEAEEHLQKEIEINPINMDTRLNLGVLYYRQKRYLEAKKMWTDALTQNPNFLPIHENLAIYYYNIERDLKQARWHVNEVVSRGGMVQPELAETVGVTQ